MEELLRELIEEVRATRQYLIESEARISLINQAESQVDRHLADHIKHVRGALGRIYTQAEESWNQSILDALNHAPVSLLPEEK